MCSTGLKSKIVCFIHWVHFKKWHFEKYYCSGGAISSPCWAVPDRKTWYVVERQFSKNPSRPRETALGTNPRLSGWQPTWKLVVPTTRVGVLLDRTLAHHGRWSREKVKPLGGICLAKHSESTDSSRLQQRYNKIFQSTKHYSNYLTQVIVQTQSAY